jgi:hypothetical protein
MSTAKQTSGVIIEGEVVGSAPLVAPNDTPRVRGVDPLVIIEQRNKAFENVIRYAISATRPEHWFDQNGKPYLGAAGSESVARRCGVSITNTRRQRIEGHDEKGSFYDWIVEATFSLPGGLDSVEGMGTCSSRDVFLGTETNAGRELYEIDSGNILKAAYSNCKVNGVTSLLGLRGLSWAFLSQFNITPDGATKVEYKAGAKGGGSASSGFTFAFGKNKGASPETVGESDLAWYRKCFTESLADPAKAKFKASNEKGVAAIDAELARRANKGAGVSAPAAGGPSIWARIQAIAADYEYERGEKDEHLVALVKATTGKAKSSDLTEADLKQMEQAIAIAVKDAEIHF